MPKSSHEPYRDPHRWMVFSVISIVYFHRVSTSVIVPDLLKAFETHATALGLMSSMYFYIYALEQPLVGYLTDRWGPVRVVGVWSLVAVFQVVTGAILNRTERVDGLYPLSGFTDAFFVCVIIIAVCLGMSFYLRNR
jgi:sugar phosphate permease